jgi:fructokinase
MPSMIVVAGEALVDRIVGPDGPTVETPGGGPFNTARTIARLGQPVAFLGCLSTDSHGAELRRRLGIDGVDMSFVVATDAPTTMATAEIDAHGGATYRFETIGTSASLLDGQAVDAALATRPAALHVGSLGLVLEPIAATLARAVAHLEPGTLLMVDPNCRPAAITDRDAYLDRLLNVFRLADVVKASREDLAYLWPETSSTDATDSLLGLGVRVVLVTDGSGPVRCTTAEVAFEVPVPEVDVADTVGAGDAFGGAFLARWTERGLGRDGLADETALREAVSLAIEVARLTCRRQGADPPHRRELAWPAA